MSLLNSSLGFGLFYWIVNIGGFFAPLMASALRGNAHDGYTWSFVFYGAAIVTAINFIPALFVYQEPEKSGEKPSVQTVWKNITTALSDFDFMMFLLIFSGFWLMFMQLWDLLPNFINQWIDSRHLASILPAALTDNGNVKAEQIININAFSIIAFMVPWSIVTGKFNRLTAITAGVLLTTVAFLGSGLFMSGTVVALMIVLFSFGEMTCSPKFSEYIGVNAPPDKKALYMGLSNIPFAFGWIIGNVMSGPLYDAFGNKLMLARRFLTTEKGYTVAKMQGIVDTYTKANPDKLSIDTLNGITIESFNFMPHIEKLLGLDTYAVNKILWNLYDPWIIWVILSGFGLLTIVSMGFFAIYKKRKTKRLANAKI
ncbi:MFS transporter [bacterium]|nr:MFS transporter [bacterium]